MTYKYPFCHCEERSDEAIFCFEIVIGYSIVTAVPLAVTISMDP